jgi:hypothetical protein
MLFFFWGAFYLQIITLFTLTKFLSHGSKGVVGWFPKKTLKKCVKTKPVGF